MCHTLTLTFLRAGGVQLHRMPVGKFPGVPGGRCCISVEASPKGVVGKPHVGSQLGISSLSSHDQGRVACGKTLPFFLVPTGYSRVWLDLAVQPWLH
jgi:hypothetical protein